MKWMSLFDRTPAEAEMSDEIRFHIESRAGELARQGLSAEEAYRRARIEFGSLEKCKEEGREARSAMLFDELCSDLRHAVRALLHNKTFATAAIAMLALGIGANTAIFSVAEFLLLRPLAVPQPEQVFAIYTE